MNKFSLRKNLNIQVDSTAAPGGSSEQTGDFERGRQHESPPSPPSVPLGGGKIGQFPTAAVQSKLLDW